MRLFPPHWCRPYDAYLRRRAEAASEMQKMKSFYARFIGAGDLCFDVGANMGNRTAALIGLGAQVICVEPQPACVKKLRNRFRKNPAVTVVETALGEKEGQGELYVCPQEPTISTMSVEWRQAGRFAEMYKGTKAVPVALTTLDRLIARYGRPVFCKIDVEGFEISVLKGLSQPITYISFEFTREFFGDAKNCIDHILSIGPALFNVSMGESLSLLWQNWVEAEVLYKNIESSDDPSLWGDIYVTFPDCAIL